jgi:hypothetical protein
MDVNDAHCHFFSHNFLSVIAAQKFKEEDPVGKAADLLGWDRPPENPAELAARWAAELDRNGVKRAALIASIPGDEGSVAAAVASYPNRFVGFFMLDPTQEGAVERTRKALSLLKLRCVCLFPAMHRYSLSDPRVYAILDAVRDAPGCAVFVHCGVLTIGIRRKLGLLSPFDLSLGNPLHLSPLAAAYPGVNFIIPHLGAGLLREALMTADVCSNVYLDTSSSNSWVRYLNITLGEAFRQALDVVGPQRLLFGTDSSFFPRGWHAKILEDQIGLFARLNIDRAGAAGLFGANFDRLFPV